MTPGEDYIGIGVGALVFNSDHKVLLAQRGSEARNESGTWEFPGGAIEFGETLTDAIHREFREEYGIKIKLVSLLGVFDHLLPNEGQHWISITYLAYHVSGKPSIREAGRCSQVGWFRLTELPAPLSQITRDNLACYLRKHPRASTC